MSKTIEHKVDSMEKQTRSPHGASESELSHSREEIARLLRSAERDFHGALRMLDANRQSEEAGRLHAMYVELRELAMRMENGNARNELGYAGPSDFLQ